MARTRTVGSAVSPARARSRLCEDTATLKRIRRASSCEDRREESTIALDQVVKLRGWDEVTAPYIRREQVDIASERNANLKGRYLFIVTCLGGLWSCLTYLALQAQAKRWEELEHADIGLAGPESSFLLPFVVSFWYLFLAYVTTRSMAGSEPVESFIFEAMVLYHLLHVAFSTYVAIAGFQEVFALKLQVVGNPAPVRGAQNNRLALTAILHYYLRILELIDTFFLIYLKKIGRSSKVHVVMRLQNVWGWHIACRFGCGGDIYFPLVANAIGSAALHLRYAVSLLGARDGRFCWPFCLLPGRESVMILQMLVLYGCLVFGSISFFLGAYPRTVLIVHISQVVVGIGLLSNFHYQGGEWEDWDQGHGETKLTFSFDSSGWCYLYHFGVGLWIQEHLADEKDRKELAFSGSSGGAITAAMLAADVDFAAVIDSVLEGSHVRARFKPWLLPSEVWGALEQFFPKDAHLRTTNRCRILLTRVFARPPFVMGEVAYIFSSRQELLRILMASCHMPFIFGLGYVLNGARYIDGLLWGSAFVPWRSFGGCQRVCRVSAFRAIGSRIAPRWNAIPPFWWPVFPPRRDALEGLMWAGYHDVAAAFGTRDSRKLECGPCSRRQSASDQRLSKDEKRIKELIHIYESTAQQHWAIVIGTIGTLTFTGIFVWLKVITAR